ncbi:MAG: TrmH family RNA methyltransferase [Myxococcota bacterium]|nr:TrmH family RNA methyltransferase [Myxococcota bacterium]
MSRDAKFFGVHACEAVFARRPDAIQRAFFTEATAPLFGPLMKQLAARRRPYRVVDEVELAKVAGTRHHEGVCVVTDPLPEGDSDAVLRRLLAAPSARLLFLDGVGNPHNVGAILRTAAHFGNAALAGDAETLSVPSGATARVAEGGAEHVPVLRWKHPLRGLERLAEHGFARVATVVDRGTPLHQAELPARCAFLLGAEREGLSREVREAADVTVTIPGTGDVESLNVNVAAAILLAEHARRHG